MSQIQRAIDALSNFRPPGVWVHEKGLYKLMPAMEGMSKAEVLTTAIESIQKGYIGNRENKETVAQGMHDITQEENALSIYMVKHGSTEEFATGSLSSQPTTRRKP